MKRTDTGKLDPDGNHAPDGILGPRHEKEGSFYSIRELWSPVHFEKRYITPQFNGKFRIQNRYHYTQLDHCTFTFNWIKLHGPGQILDFGIPDVDQLSPGQSGTLTVPLFDNWREADVLYVEATDPHGRLIHRWSWPVKSPAETTLDLTSTNKLDQVAVSESDQTITLTSGSISIEVSKRNGMLQKVESDGDIIPLSDGPHFRNEDPELLAFRHFDEGGSHHLVADYGKAGKLEWVLHPGGYVDMNLRYQPEGGRIPFTGAHFNYPEEQLDSVKYMGNGPYRVWKNRMAGGTFNVWGKPYNNTITGHSGFEYPEFKGYYSNLYWVDLTSKSGQQIKVYSKTEDLFLRLYTPEESPNPARTAVKHPEGDISFMLGIPAIGTKFKDAAQLGPHSKDYFYTPKRVEGGALQIELTFDFN